LAFYYPPIWRLGERPVHSNYKNQARGVALVCGPCEAVFSIGKYEHRIDYGQGSSNELCKSLPPLRGLARAIMIYGIRPGWRTSI